MHPTSVLSLVLLLASGTVLATPTSNTGASSCSRDEFWWNEKTCCLKSGGPANTPTVPTGKSCPDKWYWHSGKSCCTPRSQTNTPTSQSPPDCPGTHIWDHGNTCCRAPTKNDCKSAEWWWETRSCCLSHGQPPAPPSPPTGSKCPPSGFSWNNKQGCCAPHHPNPPQEPDCDKGWGWHKPTQCCKHTTPNPPPPTPSHKPKRDTSTSGVGKRTPHSRRMMVQKQKQVQFCPSGLSQCPVKGVLGEYECIDTMSELESCGGCASVGRGKDCNTISYATTSSCLGGVCVVLACDSGYKISADGESCVSPL